MRAECARTADVAVVGAGAAGLATAIFARRLAPSLSLVVLDGARKPGAKILVSGGSRCNVTNRQVTERDFWGGRSTVVRRILRAFTASDAIAFFRELGVPLHEEPGGKMFPDSNRSRDVLDALLAEVAARGAELLPDRRVVDVARDRHGFVVTTTSGVILAERVVLATGGRSLPKSGSDGAGLAIAARLGHTIVPTTPALAPLLLDPVSSFHHEVSGVAHDVEIALAVDGAVRTRISGALLWTHFGISGPAALNASRHWLRAQIEGRSVSVTVSFCPGRTFDEVEARILGAASASPKSALLTLLGTFVPASVASALLVHAGVEPQITLAHLERDVRRRLVRDLVEWPLPVTGTRGYAYAEATAGGVGLGEIDPATMASRRCPGLYLVGEMLDVDGRIGGFNFQWAWSTGFVAGRGLARGGGTAG